ncbi:MAG: SH3 domain-containing protein [Cyanobacteria bacterium REEB459]|nr:SH3 domain-containing protein [Cyanobacteria bacterium REEB459]
MNRLSRLSGLALCCLLGLTAGACGGHQKNESPVALPTAPGAVPAPGQPSPTQSTPAPGQAAPSQPSPAPPSSAPGPAEPGTPISPAQPAQLIAAQPEARINLRSGPSTTASTRGYGLVGDPVQLLRSAQAEDGLWYYVKFEQSGAEGWIRSDLITVAGRPQPLPKEVATGPQCKGMMEALAFTVYYNQAGFTLVRFLNLETKNSFDSTLTRQGNDSQGKPLYQGSATPPKAGPYTVQITDLSGGKPGSGSQLTINYNGMAGIGLCP